MGSFVWLGMFVLYRALIKMLYSEIKLPQTILPLRSNRPIGQRSPQFAVIPLLLDLVRDAHTCLLFLEQDREA
jgi:hypothetical protein